MYTDNLNLFFKNHFFFLFIFIGYVVSFILFGNFTLFYIDRLDNEIVYNHILGNFYKGNYEAAEIFLNGETKVLWLRRLFQPFSLIYIFNTEFAFWFFDILTKIISYLSFYVLAKKLIKNLYIVSLGACFFASLNAFSLWGLLISTFPYFVYLILFKEKLKLKHYIISIIVALNSEIVHSPYFVIFLFIFLIVFKGLKLKELRNLFFISVIFYTFVILSNSNILYAFIFDGPFHREEMIPLSNSFNILETFLSLFYLNPLLQDNIFSYSLAKNIPYMLFSLIFFPLIFFSKDKKLISLTLIIFTLWSLSIIINNYEFYFKKYWNPGYYYIYTVFIYSIFFLLVNDRFKKLIPVSIILILMFQTNSNFVPVAKKFVEPFKVQNFRNYYTFNGYYMKDSYSKIKKIVGEKKVISLWPIDPMVATMNEIYSLDGEHNLYPLSYKKKFFNIIKNELEDNSDFKDYYLKWGHRVYAFVNDKNNVKIDFIEAKKIGASYVISKYLVNNLNLKFVTEIKGVEILYLYEII